MNKLFSTFKNYSKLDWKDIITKELKELDYNETLVFKTLEGIDIQPFYHSNNLQNNYTVLNSTQKDWDIFTEITNQNLLNPNEVNGLVINIEKYKPNANFKNILTCRNPYLFENHFNESVNTFLKLDIYGNLFSTGNWYKDKITDENLVKNLLENSTANKVICINNSLFQNAGANIVQQLAFALSHANEYLEVFGKNSINKIYFNFAIGGNFFLETAKLRAFRYLWDSFLETKNIICESYIFSETSYRNKTSLDKDNNTIRNTLETCAAVLGRSNAVLVNSHEINEQEKSEFSQELAHKIQLILKNESYFNQFLDPIAGNYFIESLTDELIEKSSVLFKEIEKNGGLIEGFKNNSIQEMIQKSHQKEQQLFDNQQNILVGVNKYKAEDTGKEVLHKIEINTKQLLFNPILPKRLAEKTELE